MITRLGHIFNQRDLQHIQDRINSQQFDWGYSPNAVYVRDDLQGPQAHDRTTWCLSGKLQKQDALRDLLIDKFVESIMTCQPGVRGVQMRRLLINRIFPLIVPQRRYQGAHVDSHNVREDQVTAIFYLDDSDGYTEIFDHMWQPGDPTDQFDIEQMLDDAKAKSLETVPSKQNTMLLFDSLLYHRAVNPRVSENRTVITAYCAVSIDEVIPAE